MSSTTTTTVDLITDQLKGQTLRLPNLVEFYSQWPNQTSPHYEELRQTIESKIDEWISDEHVRLKARKVNLPMFSATYVPTLPNSPHPSLIKHHDLTCPRKQIQMVPPLNP